MSSNNGQKGRKEGKEGKEKERERENRNGRNRLMRKRRMGPGTRRTKVDRFPTGKKKGYLLCVAGLPSIDS
jgi:hypothetical protein